MYLYLTSFLVSDCGETASETATKRAHREARETQEIPSDREGVRQTEEQV